MSPELKGDQMKEPYKIISYFIFIFVTGYVALTQFVIEYNLFESPPLLTGPQYLVIKNNDFKINLKSESSSLEFHFTESLKHNISKLSENKETDLYKLIQSNEGDSLTIKAKEKVSLLNEDIKISLSPINSIGRPEKYFIKNVRINQKNINISNFYHCCPVNFFYYNITL